MDSIDLRELVRSLDHIASTFKEAGEYVANGLEDIDTSLCLMNDRLETILEKLSDSVFIEVEDSDGVPPTKPDVTEDADEES